MWIGQVLWPESRERAKSCVEQSKVDCCGFAGQRMPWQSEVGDKPKGARAESGGQPSGKVLELRLREAVQEEVSHNEVGRGVRTGQEHGSDAGLHTGAGAVPLAALAQKVEHGFTAVHGVGLERWSRAQKRRGKTAVAVAQQQGSGTAPELRQKVIAGVFKQRAKAEVLGPAIKAGDAIEVRQWEGRMRGRAAWFVL